MSTTKTITLSIESLNKLYFQFFDKFVTPNLLKSVNEISQLLRNKTAYDVYKYLDELFSRSENSQGYTSNQVISTLNASISNHTTHSNRDTLSNHNALSNSNPLYQYALPTNAEPKSAHIEHHKSYQKGVDKTLEESMSFKSKLGIRRTLTGLAFEQPPKSFDFKNKSQQANAPTSIYTHSNTISNDYKLDFPNTKDPAPLLPSLPPNLAKIDSAFEQDIKTKTMKDIVKKIGKIFNDNHSKIQKYNKSNNETNKLFNINTSTRLDKKDDSRKEYQFLTKPELPLRKY